MLLIEPSRSSGDYLAVRCVTLVWRVEKAEPEPIRQMKWRYRRARLSRRRRMIRGPFSPRLGPRRHPIPDTRLRSRASSRPLGFVGSSTRVQPCEGRTDGRLSQSAASSSPAFDSYSRGNGRVREKPPSPSPRWISSKA